MSEGVGDASAAEVGDESGGWHGSDRRWSQGEGKREVEREGHRWFMVIRLEEKGWKRAEWMGEDDGPREVLRKEGEGG